MSRFEQKPAFSPEDERKQNADSPQTTVMCLGVAIGAGLGIPVSFCALCSFHQALACSLLQALYLFVGVLPQ